MAASFSAALCSTLVIYTVYILPCQAAGLCAQKDLVEALTQSENSALVWYPEPCTKCTCLPSGDEECESIQCLAPDCPPGEILTFEPKECCPSCSLPYRDCQYNNQTLKHGTVYRSPQCEQCKCKDGVVTCSFLDCTQLRCDSLTEDECCSSCADEMCYDEGKLYPDQSTWSKGRCILCECNEGTKTCFSQTCPQLNCSHAYTPDGACCPICPNNLCWSKGALYEAGERWNDGPCDSCVCIRGSPQCFTTSCYDKVCPQNTVLVKREEDCCSECFPAAGVCTDSDSVTHYNGQVWQKDICQLCMCLNGKESCDTIQCSQSECSPTEYLYQEEGVCCPVCKAKDYCMYEGFLRSTQELTSWKVDDCKRCTCVQGQPQCYENSCFNNNSSNSQLSVKVIAPVLVTRWENALVSAANLEIQAISLDDVRLTVIQGPEHGVLHEGNKEFSYQELMDGLEYQHDGSGEPDDFILLQAGDSQSLQNVLLPVSVEASSKLVLVNNSTLEVAFGLQAKFTRTNLLYEAGGDNKTHLIKYTVTQQPNAGSILMIVPKPAGTSLQAGWTTLPDGTMFKQIEEFSQTDINDGYIYYQHEASSGGDLMDYFIFEVKYEESMSVLANQLFAISIQPAEVFDAPSVAAGSSLSLVVSEGETVTITSSSLSFEDEDSTAEDILFTITQPLPYYQGMIELASAPKVPISSFTQKDINDGLLAYRSPADLEVGLTQPTYLFKFNVYPMIEVTDNNSKAILNQEFTIIILPVDNKAPSVGEGVRVNVERDRSTLINDDLLQVVDVDTPKENLQFTLIYLPQHGDIVKMSDMFHAVIRAGFTYSYTEMLSDTIYYVHDNSAPLEDSFTIQFSDSVQSAEVEIPVTIQYSDTESPTLSPSASMKLRLNEGEKKVITLSELEYLDESADGLVFYQIANEPRFGTLYHKSQAMQLADGFTHTALVSRFISYQAFNELGNIEIMDTIYLNVSDTLGNMAAMQPFTVSITATDNHPPIVSIGSDLVVEEGRRKQLTKTHISAQDPDSILTNLMVVVNAVPTLGTLKIITSDGLESGIRQSQVHMFLLSDLYAGIVYYDQTDHEGTEPRSDFFWFHMSDGENISPVERFNITITPDNDEPPVIVSGTVFIEEGETAAITNSSLYVNDIDSEFDDIDSEFDANSAASHVFTVTRVPREGNLQTNNGTVIRTGDSFTMENILDGEIFYSHHGREDVSQDAFTVVVSDGMHEDIKSVSVDIALLDDETPRIKINDGLRIKAGGEIVLDSSVLYATDIDSDDEMLIFIITQPVHRGILYMSSSNNGSEQNISLFTPVDLREGVIKYRNTKDINEGGFDFFKFDVVDLNDNRLIGQVLYIDLLADNSVPVVRVNSPLSVREDGFAPITTSHLYITDEGPMAEDLVVYIDVSPEFGSIVLEDDNMKAHPVESFKMTDIVANRIFYVHESEKEAVGDSFKFTASDGFNNVTQSFRVRFIQVDDSLPVATIGKLFAAEGQDKEITEFEIKIADNDTAEESLLITLLAPPTHGNIILTRDGEEVDAACTIFTMADIYNGAVSYRHDNTESSSDWFTFVVTDQSNKEFYIERDGKLIKTTSPLTLEITIQLLDDQIPRIIRNTGIRFLETDQHEKHVAKITSRQLKIEDADTREEEIVIKITRIPKYGILSRLPEGTTVSQFTQDDVTNGLIVYTMSDDVTDTRDDFEFSVFDSKPNTVDNVMFNIAWSYVSLSTNNITAEEMAGTIEVPVRRTGSLQEYSTVKCELERSMGDEHYSSDITVLTPQIQFEKGHTTSACRLSIVNDTVYEGVEDFVLKLSSPVKTLMADDSSVSIRLTDLEDLPLIEFRERELIVNESVGSANVPVIRSGDLSQPITVLCTTTSQTAMGSEGNHLLSGTDYISRNDYVVKFEAGEAIANCNIRILDDTLYEVKEQFEVVLSSPSPPAELKQQTKATVIIDGPNDVSTIHMAATELTVFEDEESAFVEIVRTGLDLSRPSSVWCTTKMLSQSSQAATPSEDYIPISRKILFDAGQRKALCEITIIDDVAEPRREGVEKFVVTIISADSRSIVAEPSATVINIDDSDLDVPLLSFETAKHTVDEKDGKISMPIVRTGDVSCTVSVICYTRQQTASVMADYQERPLTNESRVELLAGETSAACDLEIIDDEIYETSEFLLLRLAEPVGCGAMTGDLDVTLLNIEDAEDEPLISIESSSYSIREPISSTDYTSVKVTVRRQGDSSQPAAARVSTRDRSAMSGVDYVATSLVLPFMPGERSKLVDIEILYNPEVEWHESFVVVLEELAGVSAGENSSAVINILDTDVAGSLVLPTVPIVVSLADYESGSCDVVEEVSPGYPLICLSPCDPLYPQYAETEEICQSSNINSSAIQYGWELSYPVRSNGKVSAYLKVAQATTFSKVDTQLLETFHFRAGFNVRCIATPVRPDGHTGVPIRSASVAVHSRGVCSNPVIPNSHGALGAQSFTASLDYVEPEASSSTSNKIHIKVEIPHQDGMLPLISTMPIYNVDYLLTQTSFTKQHFCSNLPNTSDISTSSEINGFLSNDFYSGGVADPPGRVDKAVQLYRHLNRVTCRWTFEAWYELSHLVDYCGGRVTRNFDVESASNTFVTVHQPLHVSYIYAKAPAGWVSLDHQTTLEFSFYYDSVKFHTGVDILQEPDASVDIIRVGIGEDGKLAMQLRTHAKFRGLLVLNHYTALSGQVGEIVAPDTVDSRFNLRLVWSQPTYDGPVQIWRVVSRYSLQDYSGTYTLHLLACVATASQSYADSGQHKCSIQKVLSFPLQIAFQQSNRPVPAVYTLNTQFQVTNSKRFFLMDPMGAVSEEDGGDFHGVFEKGERLFGRVFWDPSQDLDSAFRIQLDKVFICAGRDGYTPTYDPTGVIYNEGAQYGCLESSNKLKHRFLLLDRGQEDVTTKYFYGLPFKANFADSMPGLAEINDMPGTDGFVMSVDPLFAMTAGQRWHLHILYRIDAADAVLQGRRRRALPDSKLGNNLLVINLQQHADSGKLPTDVTSQNPSQPEVVNERIIETKYVLNSTVIIILVVVAVLVVSLSIGTAVYVKHSNTQRRQTTADSVIVEVKEENSAENSKLPPSYEQVVTTKLDHENIGTTV